MSDVAASSDETSEILEIPQVYTHHVFCCQTQRPPESPHPGCGDKGGLALWERLRRQLEVSGRRDIAVTASGCLGFCAAGPIMVVYPQGIWYAPRTAEDIDEILAAHLIGGRPVERLIIVPRI